MKPSRDAVSFEVLGETSEKEEEDEEEGKEKGEKQSL